VKRTPWCFLFLQKFFAARRAFVATIYYLRGLAVKMQQHVDENAPVRVAFLLTFFITLSFSLLVCVLCVLSWEE
jgi:hypothetical protein